MERNRGEAPVRDRLIELCKAINTTPNQFSQKIGRSREFIRKITGEIGTDAIRNIIEAFPEVNIIWLITGKGDMFIPYCNLPPNETLSSYLIKENRKLKEENKMLLLENGKLTAKLDFSNTPSS